jgi:hypothetical protein
MTPTEIVRATLGAIASSGLDYVLVGAFATGYHAFPRSTKDADFVVGAPLGAISHIAPHFPPTFHVDPQPQMEMLTGTYRWIIRVDGTEFRVEIFHLGGDPHHEVIFHRRVAVDTPEFGGKVWVPTAEDLVIQKLRWGRPKDTEDARNILSVQGNAIDFAHIETWCAQHGTLDRLAAVRATVPPEL